MFPALPSTGVLERLPRSGPAQSLLLSWAQHERAFNELSEEFLLFYKNAKINKAPNLLEIK